MPYLLTALFFLLYGVRLLGLAVDEKWLQAIALLIGVLLIAFWAWPYLSRRTP